MATTYKVLGQSNPAANTLTTAYTAPVATKAVVSTIVVSNQGAGATTYRIAIRPAGAAIAQTHYIAYDLTIPALDSLIMTIGLTLDATDVISVESYSGLVNFSIFGSEIS